MSKKIKSVIRDFDNIKEGRDLVRYMLQNYCAIKTELEAVDIIIDLRNKRKPMAPNTTLRKCWTIVASEVKYGDLPDEELRYIASTAQKYMNMLDIAIRNLGNNRDMNMIKDYYIKHLSNKELSIKYKIDIATIEQRRTISIRTLGEMFELGACVDLVHMLNHIGLESTDAQKGEE